MLTNNKKVYIKVETLHFRFNSYSLYKFNKTLSFYEVVCLYISVIALSFQKYKRVHYIFTVYEINIFLKN